MRFAFRSCCFGAMLVVAGSTSARAQKANDPVIGTWVYNAAKSKPAAGAEVLKSGTRMYEVVGGKLHSAGQSVRASGVDKYEFTGAYDGKDAPYTGSGGDRIAMTAINDRTVDATLKRGTAVLQKTRREVSADGKTLTMTTTRYDAAGKTTMSITVYDRK